MHNKITGYSSVSQLKFREDIPSSVHWGCVRKAWERMPLGQVPDEWK